MNLIIEQINNMDNENKILVNEIFKENSQLDGDKQRQKIIYYAQYLKNVVIINIQYFRN